MGIKAVEIDIKTKADLAAVTAAKAVLGELHAALKNIGGISLGVGLERAFEGFKNRIVEGMRGAIEFNKEMESVGFTLAAMQRQFNPGKFHDFNAALAASPALLEAIKKKAAEYHLGIMDTVEAYKTTAGAMFHGGVRDLQKQLDLAVMLQSAMREVGISGFQAVRDAQDILMGSSHMTKAGKELGLSDEDIKRAADAGKLYEFLEEKLGSYAEAGKAAGDTLAAKMTELNSEVQMLESELGKPMFEEMKLGLAAVIAEMKSLSSSRRCSPLPTPPKFLPNFFSARHRPQPHMQQN
jgi:hypothetical protein